MFVVFLLLLSLHSIESSADSLNYMPYYRAMNRAEQLIAHLRMRSALRTYDSAFKIFPKHRLSDLHNASLCALHCKQPAKAQAWIMEGISKGMKLESLNTETFKRQPSDFWRPIEQRYDSLRSIYQAEVECWAWFKTIIDTMSAREQYAIGALELTEYDYDTMRYSHAQQLYRLIDSVGIPPWPVIKSAATIAVLMHNKKLRNALHTGELDTLNEPYRQMDMRRYDLTPLFYKHVCNGDIDPNEIFFYVDRGTIDGKFKGSFFIPQPWHVRIDYQKKKILFSALGKDVYDIDSVEHSRLQWGLPGYADVMRTAYKMQMLLTYADEYPFDDILQVWADSGCYQSEYRKILNSPKRYDFHKKCRQVVDKYKKEFDEKIRYKIMQEALQNRELSDATSESIKMIEFKFANYSAVIGLSDRLTIDDINPQER